MPAGMEWTVLEERRRALQADLEKLRNQKRVLEEQLERTDRSIAQFEGAVMVVSELLAGAPNEEAAA